MNKTNFDPALLQFWKVPASHLFWVRFQFSMKWSFVVWDKEKRN